MTQSKVYSFRALYIYISTDTDLDLFLFCFTDFSSHSVFTFRTIAHAQYFLPHFIRGIFDFLICSLHFVRLSQEEKKKKEEATPLFEWVPILSWWLFAFLSDVLVPFWSLPYWPSSADCQLYTTVCLISKVEIIVECYRVVMLKVEESLLQPCHTYTHTYSPLLSPPHSQPPLPLSFSWSPSRNLLVFLETLTVFLKCLSVTWFAATTENSDSIRQEGITKKKKKNLATWMWQWLRYIKWSIKITLSVLCPLIDKQHKLLWGLHSYIHLQVKAILFVLLFLYCF